MAWPWTFATLPAGNVAASKLDDNFNAAAQLDSPALTGTPTAPTATRALNNTQLATTAYVDRVAVQQVVYSAVNTAANGSTSIPFDDTKPQKTEGTEFVTATITPKSATSRLVITVNAPFWSVTPDAITMALFQDATADALAATYSYNAANNGVNITLTYQMTSGTTSPTTFKMRAGNNGGTAIYLNGTSGTQVFGGVASTVMSIMEIGV